MSWSCRADAMDSLDVISRAMDNPEGISNEWTKNGRLFFTEISRKEHQDGSISGQVIELFSTPDPKRFHSKTRGTIKINGNGYVVRFPNANKTMKKAIQDINAFFKQYQKI